jgi:PadR family transcriptional regulator PadR
VAAGAREVNELIDTDSANRKFEKELKSGTAALILLGVISRSGHPMYGYQITKEIEAAAARPGSRLLFRQGALYPVLRSMEKGGILESEIEPSVSGPPRRYYSITEEGRTILEDWKVTWENTKDLVDGILKGNDDV